MLRYTIKDIRNHPWYNQVEPNEQPGVIIGKDVINVNQNILDILLRDYAIDPEKCRNEVQRNKFNDLTTSYYLIAKRKERAGIFRQQYKDELKLMFSKKK